MPKSMSIPNSRNGSVMMAIASRGRNVRISTMQHERERADYRMPQSKSMPKSRSGYVSRNPISRGMVSQISSKLMIGPLCFRAGDAAPATRRSATPWHRRRSSVKVPFWTGGLGFVKGNRRKTVAVAVGVAGQDSVMSCSRLQG